MEGINCHNCLAACCTAKIFMEMTAREADFLREAGTVVLELVAPQDGGQIVPYPVAIDFDRKDPEKFEVIGAENEPPAVLLPGVGIYWLKTDCGYLRKEKVTGWRYCGVYNDPRKPDMCSAFEEGSLDCIRMRKSKGVAVNFSKRSR